MNLFCFGFGYTAQILARQLKPRGWRIAGTVRDSAALDSLRDQEIEPFLFDELPSSALEGVSHVLVSVPPDADDDPTLRRHRPALLRHASQLSWVGYLSTTGVYGDRGGDWVDETTPLAPSTERGRRRVAAEEAWRATGLPLHIFRLAGIYGPGRNPLLSILDGTSRRIVKPGQVFSRIHVEDIAGVLAASMARPDPGAIYNVCDDAPAPPQEVIAHAAQVLGRPPPREVAFEEAALSPMARSFYAESKRVSNNRIKRDLGYRLLYPTYREGLGALLSDPGISRISAT